MAVFRITARTLRELQWPELLQALAERTRTPIGHELAAELDFLSERKAVEERLQCVEEVRALRRAELLSPNHDVVDLRPVLIRLERSAVLSGLELLSGAKVIQTSARVRSFFQTHRLLAPSVAAIAEGLPRLTPIARRITDMVEPSGLLKDSASDALAEYRGRARSLHQAIQSRIKSILDDPGFSEVLRDDYFSVRNERYVVPIISSFRSRVPGIVHNASGSGQTIFVEPEAVIGLGNDLSITQSLVLEEEERIYAELSTDLADYVAPLRDTLDRLARIDLLEACGSLSDALQSTRPEIDETGAFSLPESRHPLLVLQGKAVVPNTITLDPDQRALVVSGPNAGGKTVTMTALGLSALLLRAGLPTPAGAGCRVPLVSGLGSVIGDAQDMSRDLSTFTAHLGRLAEIIDAAGGGWLVLIDEIAADTDPTEGAALAVAVLETLVERHVRIVVTTHLDDVKAIAITDERFVNARMAIDPQSLRPNYRLQLGTAGSSNALAMARQTGLPEQVIERAERHLREGSKLSVALATLEEERQELERQHGAWKLRSEELAFERESLEAERERLAEERRAAKRQAYAEVEAEIGHSRREISRTIAEIQRAQDMRRAQQTQRSLEQESESLRIASQRLATESEVGAVSTQPAPAKIAVGGRVRVSNLGQDGQVIELLGDEALVSVGALRTRAKIRDLVSLPPKAKEESRAPGKPDRKRSESRVVAAELEHPESRLDIRGMRADDARKALDDFIDLLVLKGPPLAIVVHGHGTGVLRRVVREVFDASTDVSSYRAGGRHEGGDGVTVFEIG